MPAFSSSSSMMDSGAGTTRSFREIARMLERCPWGRGLAVAQLESIGRHLRCIEPLKGSFIFREGSQEPYLCILVSGSVAILKCDSTGRRKRIAELGPGQSFGEMSLFDEEPRSASAMAEENCVILILTREEFQRMIQDMPQLAIQVILRTCRQMSLRLRKTSAALAELLPSEPVAAG